MTTTPQATNLDESKEWFLENPTGHLTCVDDEGREQICTCYVEAKEFFGLPTTPIKELIAAGTEICSTLQLILGDDPEHQGVLQRWEDAKKAYEDTHPDTEPMNLSSRGPNKDSIVHMAFFSMLSAIREEHPLIERLTGIGLEKVDVRFTCEGIQLPFEEVFKNWSSQMDRMINETAVKMLKDKFPNLSEASENLNPGCKKLVRNFRKTLGLPEDEEDWD